MQRALASARMRESREKHESNAGCISHEKQPETAGNIRCSGIARRFMEREDDGSSRKSSMAVRVKFNAGL